MYGSPLASHIPAFFALHLLQSCDVNTAPALATVNKARPLSGRASMLRSLLIAMTVVSFSWSELRHLSVAAIPLFGCSLLAMSSADLGS